MFLTVKDEASVGSSRNCISQTSELTAASGRSQVPASKKLIDPWYNFFFSFLGNSAKNLESLAPLTREKLLLHTT